MKNINVSSLFLCFMAISLIHLFGSHWSLNHIYPLQLPQSKLIAFIFVFLLWRHATLMQSMRQKSNQESWLKCFYLKFTHLVFKLYSYHYYQPTYLLVLGTPQSNKSGFLKSIHYTETVLTHSPNQRMWYNKSNQTFAIESLMSEQNTSTIFLRDSKTPAKPNQCILILKPSDLLNLDKLTQEINKNPILTSNIPIKILISHMDQITGFNAYFSKMTTQDRDKWWQFSLNVTNDKFKALQHYFSLSVDHILTNSLRILSTSPLEIKDQLIEFPLQLSSFHCKLLQLIQSCKLTEKCNSIHFMSQLQNSHPHDLIKEYYDTSRLHLPLLKTYNPPINFPHFTHNILNQTTPLPNFGLWGQMLSSSWVIIALASWVNTPLSLPTLKTPSYTQLPTSQHSPIHLSIQSLTFSQQFQLAQLLNQSPVPKEQLINLLTHLWPQYPANTLYQWIIQGEPNSKPVLLTHLSQYLSQQSNQQKISDLKHYFDPELNSSQEPWEELCHHWKKNIDILGNWSMPLSCQEYVQTLYYPPKKTALVTPQIKRTLPIENEIIPSHLTSITEWHQHLKQLTTHPEELRNTLQELLNQDQLNLKDNWQQPVSQLINDRQLPVIFIHAYNLLDKMLQPKQDSFIFETLLQPPSWLSQPPTDFWAQQLQPYLQQFVLDQVRQSIDEQYQKLVATPFEKNLQKKYPFGNNTENPSSLKSIVALFGKEGSINTFQQFIDPWIDKHKDPWKWKKYFNQPLLKDNESLSFLMHINIIQALLMDKDLNNLSIDFSLYPQFMHTDTLLTLSQENQPAQKMHKGSQALHLNWPHDFKKPLTLSLYTSSYTKPKTLVIKHPWEWFSKLQTLNLQLDNEQTAHMFIDKEPIEIQSNKIINPLNMRWLNDFKCPKHFI
ncbi:MAG TPA: type VI secretion protein IcmF/TssM N-terminal domain-containing protein [Gammaproteobacteria bacterium]|nr:type VI secretion protein IcmF/TssM N-terminal domain-containing protein [Gammaproteobacteria bacterium]